MLCIPKERESAIDGFSEITSPDEHWDGVASAERSPE
jgi:hypothetical protein